MISPIEDGCVPARLDRGKTCRARLVSHRISQVLFCLGLLLFADVSCTRGYPANRCDRLERLTREQP